jgi:energy-coupling factor transporter transmembrane protein EcfT
MAGSAPPSCLARLDPRAQLAWLVAVVVGALLGGLAGVAAAAALAGGLLALAGDWRGAGRMVLALLPVAGLIAVLDAIAGQGARGLLVGARVLSLALAGRAFARYADGEAMIAGLQALRIPYAVTFVLVAGARYVPQTAADLAQLRDAARLRGVPLDGPPWRQLAAWRRLLVPLILDTIRRGLQLGESMEARAFGAARQRTVRHRLSWRWRDTAATLGAGVYVVAVLAAARLLV